METKKVRLSKDRKRVIDLIKQKEALNKQYKEVKEELEQILLQEGEGTMFQDKETEVVYQIVVPKGGFVFYDKIGLKNTNAEGVKGSGTSTLSKVKAKEAGFKITY